MSNCLTPLGIERLVKGDLQPDEVKRALAHLGECRECEQRVESRRTDEVLCGDIKRAHDVQTQSLRAAPAGPSASEPPLPRSIKGYDIRVELGRGGQGVVYRAVQKSIKRPVALKVLLQGPYASEHQRRRFEREIDLVASLHHPNIVTVFDSGVTEDGLPYFAMEYIHGAPLDTYVSQANLTMEAKLRLFLQICAAVSYAHRHGVIHRDLKPANIRIDAEGEPHVLDFGLAKAAGAGVTDTYAFMGTLAYASPEQARGDPHAIDTRTDVYSLGIILYELLTGKLPYPLVGGAMKVLRNITEVEPHKPSDIHPAVNEELETIILTALAKGVDQRYQSAEALDRDIAHYLNGEPIDAKRDSTWYVIRKSLRRYRIAVAVAAAFVLFTTASSIALSILYRRAAAAERALASVLDLNEVEQFDELAAGEGPRTAQTGRAQERADEAYERACVRLTEGNHDAAITDFDEVLRIEPKRALAHANRGLAYYRKGEYAEALVDANAALRINPRLAGAETLRQGAQRKLAEQAQTTVGGGESAEAFYTRAAGHFLKGRYHEAIADFDKVIQADPNHALAHANRGYAHYRLHDYEKALADLERAAAIDPNIPSIKRFVEQARHALKEKAARPDPRRQSRRG